MNVFRNILRDIRLSVKKYLNLFKCTRDGYAAPVDAISLGA
jgi:hypothetical protein